mmetsp:Transcript_36291/g.49848  ORF Transcript_36291/g.49848 Transcript_36291/m.49848 type:complete len:319 (+) Transcript_36291:323-1279(+)
MSMTSSSKIFRRSTIFHRKSRLRNHLSSLCINNMNSQNTISFRISKDFDNLFRVEFIVCSRSTVCLERERSNLVFHSFFLQILFCFSDPSNFRESIDNTRNSTVVNMSSSWILNIFNSCDSFFFSFVCKHWTSHNIANGSNGWDICLEVFVNHYTTTIVHLDTNFVQTKSLSERNTSNRDKNNICFNFFRGRTISVLNFNSNSSISVLRSRSDFRSHFKFHPLFLQDFLKVRCDFIIRSSSNRIHKLNRGHFRTKSIPNRSQFQTNHTSSNQNQPLGNFFERESASRRNNLLLINIKTRDGHHVRTSRNQDILCFQGL